MTSTSIDTEIARIQAALEQGKFSVAQLARASGVAKTTLTGITSDTWNPRALTLRKVIKGLQKLAKPQRATKKEKPEQ